MSREAEARVRRWSWPITGMALAMFLFTQGAIAQRTEEGFPLTFDRTFVDLGDGLTPGEDIEVPFLVTNPTDEPVTYFSKPSSRSVSVTHEHITLEPGESGEFVVTIKPRHAGPFRHRVGVVVEPTRSALWIEGWAGQ